MTDDGFERLCRFLVNAVCVGVVGVEIVVLVVVVSAVAVALGI